MAQLTCSECGRRVPSTDEACPQCGYAPRGSQAQLVISVVVAVIFAGISLVVFYPTL